MHQAVFFEGLGHSAPVASVGRKNKRVLFAVAGTLCVADRIQFLKRPLFAVFCQSIPEENNHGILDYQSADL
jgi:hypothetical protein